MKHLLIVMLFAVSAAGQDPAVWTEPVEPFRIVGDVYYVGSAELSSFLITTPEGHILLDAPMEQNVPHILRSIRELGFDPADIEIMINSHGHYDHAGGFAEMKRVTGAKLLASAVEAELIEAGGRGPFSFGESSHFTPVKVDRYIEDDEVVELGGVELLAIMTPGHTKGGASWLLETESDGQPVTVLFANSMSAVYDLVDNEDYPSIVEDLRASFDRLEQIEADVFLATHGSFYRLAEKREALGGAENPFVDREESMRFVERWRGIVERQYAEQVEEKAVAKVLDRFHEAASAADGETYFSLFARGAVFIGTDAGERWSVVDFMKFAEPYFSQGRGWTYIPEVRNVEIDESRDTAWFDEILENESYGTTRGTGVLVKSRGEWKIAQYHLTIPIPNELAKDIVAMIRGE